MSPPAPAALAALGDLVLPVVCAGCGAVGTPWCTRCRAAFARPGYVELPGLAPVLALAPYAGAARETVLAYKERGRRDLAAPLARAVAHALTGAGIPPAAVVPAPSRRSAARARGGDHVLRLARALAGPGPGVARALALRAGARDSVGLDAAARAANLGRHLRLRPSGLAGLAPGAAVVLLDDVLTTGATARAACRLLGAVGLTPVVVVLTAVPAREGRRGDPIGPHRPSRRHSNGGRHGP